MFLHLAPEVRITLAAIFAALAIATVALAAFKKFSPARDVGELFDRLRTWWVIVVLFAAALAPSPTSAAFSARTIPSLRAKSETC